MSEKPIQDPELRLAFAENERWVTIQNYRVGCILGIVFMPAGVALDYFVYREQVGYFLQLRLLCSLLLGSVWGLLHTTFGSRHYRVLGLIEVALPLAFISWMILATEGPSSPYYAGLNLVLMGAGIVLRWSLEDSVWVLVLALGMYLASCALYGPIRDANLFFNNLYFLVVTGVFIITGNYFYNRLRFREFALRFELDKNRKMLEEGNRRLVELDQVKSHFFANISHELRTPLTLLLAPLETLLQDRSRAGDPQVRDWLETMHANGMRLLKLINDLLDLVRLESGKMEVHCKPMVVADFVQGLANSVRKVAEDKHVRLETVVADNLGTLLADEDKLEKIVLNLVFNALKFTPAGGRVKLQAEGRDHELVLQVQDTGKGISGEQLPFLFQRFWQADTSSRRKFSGVGIGLALVKELVEIQGGKVTVESQEGKGTTFTVRLPCTPAEPAGAVEVKTEPPAGAPSEPGEQWLANLYRRAELFPSITLLRESVRPVELPLPGHLPCVLVADDEPDMLRFLKSQLSDQFQVLEAVDGEQAIAMAAQFIPDVVLCDMMMPEKDGMQVCRELRECLPTQSIPIVLLTARADEETKLAALAAGASDFLTKPFSTTELHVRLKNLVAAYHLHRKVARQNQVLEATLEQLKDTETQLVQSEKMASLGRMSAGIIHEINNPLNFVKTGLYTLRKKESFLPQEQQPDFAEIVRDVEEGINRVKNIVADLRVFTHPDATQCEEVLVDEIMTAALRLLSNEWKDKVRIERSIPVRQTIWGNRNRLIQVLINLLQNALDAMKNKEFREIGPTIWIDSRAEENRIKLAIRDNGQGIPKEFLDKIFEPFFTTKEVGEGMGLGLSICYRIVAEHQGRITVASEVGQFTQFTLEFPGKTPISAGVETTC